MLTLVPLSASTATFIAKPQLAFRPASRPAAVRLGINFGMGAFGLGDAVKLPSVQSFWNEVVAADGLMLERDEGSVTRRRKWRR